MAQTKPIKYVEVAFGDRAKITRCIGYCKKHTCYLTKTNLENMSCLQKGCKHLVKLMKHPYWKEIERLKQEAKKKKEYRRKIYENN